MHIIIVGGGPAGLVAYLALKQSLPKETTFTILERHRSDSSSADSTTFAGALGLAPNGLRVLKHISPALFEKVKKAGYENDSFKFQTAGGWTLGAWKVKSLLHGEEWKTVFIERRQLWNVLRDQVPKDLIREGAKVIEVKDRGVVVLGDGTELQGDLIIGADGIRSVVRKSVVATGEPGRVVTETEVMDVGGHLPAKYIREAKDASTVMTFGATGFVGYGITSEDSNHGPGAVWWSTYQGASGSPTSGLSADDPLFVQQLVERHGKWSDPVIKKLLADLAERGSHSTSTSLAFAAPKVALAPLPRWNKGRVILVGDAAHAVASSSGQGVSMAFEDALVLAKVLQKALKDKSDIPSKDEIEAAGQEYYNLRHKRVEQVRIDGERGNSKKRIMNSFEVGMLYTILWSLMKLGVGDSWKMDYDIQDVIGKEI